MPTTTQTPKDLRDFLTSTTYAFNEFKDGLEALCNDPEEHIPEIAKQVRGARTLQPMTNEEFIHELVASLQVTIGNSRTMLEIGLINEGCQTLGYAIILSECIQRLGAYVAPAPDGQEV